MCHMRAYSGCCFLSLLLIHFAGAAVAADDMKPLQKCLDMQNREAAETELNCYRQAATESAAERSLVPLRTQGLSSDWKPTNDPLNVYKQTYALLYAHSSQTNDMPTSPNPQNQVLTASPQDNRNLKIQISFKHDLADFNRYGSLWFGYTQLSFWQVYDRANSRPFRETDYEPEFIYSYRTANRYSLLGINPTILNVGLVHQSNGQSNPRSRSWNRIYIQSGMEHDNGDAGRLDILVRWWQRIKENSRDDDNPDITNYLGHGDIEIRYSQYRKWEVSLTGKARSIQIDLAAPWPTWEKLSFIPTRRHNTNLHVQYFSGYGESLVDYNQKHETWGIGLSFPFE